MPGGRQPGSSRPTLKDVAEHAGVALSTASLVFSGNGPVADSTARRVRESAVTLGYGGPDPVAASLRQGRAGTVAVLVEGTLRYSFQDPFALAVLDGIAAGLDEIGSAMLLVPGLRAETAPPQVATSAVDAAIFALCGPRRDASAEILARRRVPMVGTGAPDHERVVHLLADERGASAEIARHVRDLGHRRVAHVMMPLRSSTARTREVEATGIAHADYPDAGLRAAGTRDVFPTARWVETVAPTLAEGEVAGRLLLDRPAGERPTAILAQSDVLAAGVVRAATTLGLSVPDQLSVTGFDGVDLPWLDVVLTTVVQDGERKGRRLVEMVEALLTGETPPPTTFATALRIGDSTAVVPT